MQARDATTVYLLKLWPWVEANKNRLIAGATIIVVVVFIIWFSALQRAQKQIAAGEAVTQLAITPGGQTAEAWLKVAADHPNTVAGQRAQLQAATILYTTGQYAEARVQFQKYLDAHPDGEFSGQAGLGVAASLEAQNKTDLADGAYRRLANSTTDPAVISAAKFALGRIDENQGHYNEALDYYQDVWHANPNTSLGSEAGLRLMELRNKMPTTAPANTPAATPVVPFKLSQ